MLAATFWQRGVIKVFIFFFFIGFLWSYGSAQVTSVNWGVVFVNVRVTPLWVAEKEGYFRKNGLDVKIKNISGGTQGAQALVSGGIDLMD